MMTSSLPLAPVITTNSQSAPSSPVKPQTAGHYYNHGSKIPFENSRMMDECRVEVLRKFRKEIVGTVRFGDVSRVLISCGLVSKEECFEICKLNMSKQMTQCYQKVHDIMDILVCQKVSASENEVGDMTSSGRLGAERCLEETDKQNGLVKDIWKNFISALRQEHGQLAGRMENELDKSAESRLLMKRGSSGSTRSLIRKEDIGSPRDFHHVKHYGLISDKRRRTPMRVQGDGAAAAPTNSPPSATNELNFVSDPMNEVDENDADLKEFFKRAGVVSRHLLNPVTKQIIVRFIAENGGMNAIREEVRQEEPLPPPLPTKQGDLTSSTPEISSPLMSKNEGRGGTIKRIANVFGGGGRSSSESQLAHHKGGGAGIHGEPPPAPATVPFRPTPRPTSNLFYF